MDTQVHTVTEDFYPSPERPLNAGTCTSFDTFVGSMQMMQKAITADKSINEATVVGGDAGFKIVVKRQLTPEQVTDRKVAEIERAIDNFLASNDQSMPRAYIQTLRDQLNRTEHAAAADPRMGAQRSQGVTGKVRDAQNAVDQNATDNKGTSTSGTQDASKMITDNKGAPVGGTHMK